MVSEQEVENKKRKKKRVEKGKTIKKEKERRKDLFSTCYYY